MMPLTLAPYGLLRIVPALIRHVRLRHHVQPLTDRPHWEHTSRLISETPHRSITRLKHPIPIQDQLNLKSAGFSPRP